MQLSPDTVCVSTKAQHRRAYQALPTFLRELREQAELSQRELGDRVGRPQSWIHNCESRNRRVDVTEFTEWVRACGVKPEKAFAALLKRL